MARPSPVPPNRRVVDESAWAKALNNRSWSSSAMPMPVSITSKCSATRSEFWWRTLTRITTSPSEVNFTALAPKLSRTCRILVPSPSSAVGTSGWTSTRSSIPLACAVLARIRPTSSTTLGTSSADSSISSFPASIFEKSRMSLMITKQALGRQLHARGELGLLLVEIGLEQEVGEPDDAVHRRPDLVAHRRDELRLRPGGDQGRIPRRDQVLGRLACLGHVTTVEDVPVDRRVVEEVGGRPVDDPPLPVRLAHAHLEDRGVGMVVGQPGEVLDDRAGVVGVHEVGERPALELIRRVPEHALRRRA